MTSNFLSGKYINFLNTPVVTAASQIKEAFLMFPVDPGIIKLDIFHSTWTTKKEKKTTITNKRGYGLSNRRSNPGKF